MQIATGVSSSLWLKVSFMPMHPRAMNMELAVWIGRSVRDDISDVCLNILPTSRVSLLDFRRVDPTCGPSDWENFLFPQWHHPSRTEESV